MPWLIKGNDDPSQNLFFVHVPRCGGTSLTSHYDVPKKAMEGRSLWGRIGLRIFFHRYEVLESANFPWKTKGTGGGLVALLVGLYLTIAHNEDALRRVFGILLFVAGFLLIVCLGFLFTAPVIGRITMIRRVYLILIHHAACRFMESIAWCTGTNKTGYMMHLTAKKLLNYGYVTSEEMTNCCTMAIVRNPYSRMVSIYKYNRFGSLESFPAFVEDWYNRMTKPYRETGELEEWWTPCHTIPQFEFTHHKGTQLVRSIVKQEELKFLKTEEGEQKAVEQDSSVSNLPPLVRSALLGMPHKNARSSASKKWYDYYDQRTLDLVHEMYEKDFTVFNYSPILSERPDLDPPAGLIIKKADIESTADVSDNGDDDMDAMSRDSWSLSQESVSKRRSVISSSIPTSVFGIDLGNFKSSLFRDRANSSDAVLEGNPFNGALRDRTNSCPDATDAKKAPDYHEPLPTWMERNEVAGEESS